MKHASWPPGICTRRHRPSRAGNRGVQANSPSGMAMSEPPRRLRHQPGTLKGVLHPGVAARARMPAPAEAVEVLDVPAIVALAVQRLGAQYLVDRGATRRDLAQPLVHQPVEPLVLVAVHVAPERALTHPQPPHRLLLRQPPSLLSAVGFLESHRSDHLQHLCPGHGAPPWCPSNRTTHVLQHWADQLLLTIRTGAIARVWRFVHYGRHHSTAAGDAAGPMFSGLPPAPGIGAAQSGASQPSCSGCGSRP